MPKVISLISFLFLLVQVSLATNYYVSPSGNDGYNGLSPASPWRSIDNGDAIGLLLPGDTVNVLSGTYFPLQTIQFTISGTSTLPIVYQRLGKSPAMINGNNRGFVLVLMDGAHTTLRGLELSNINDHGIHLRADSSVVTECYLHNTSHLGLRVEGSFNLIKRNVIALTNDSGIKNEGAGVRNQYYGNTIYSTNKHGIELAGGVSTVRIFNNIVTENRDRGITGAVANVCGYNNVWGNAGGNYSGGVVDSAGGISVFPEFVNPTSGRFDLKRGAAEIDAGLPLGYSYNGIAPDMGAIEKYNHYYVSPSGNDSWDGKSPGRAWASIDNGDSLLLPGDTVFVTAGSYPDSVVINRSGDTIDDVVTILGVRDSTEVNGNGKGYATRLNGSYLTWSGISIRSSNSANLYSAGQGNTVEGCRILSSHAVGIFSLQACNLIRNVIASNATTGVYELSGNNARVFNNTFFGNGHYAYRAGGDSHLLINNIFVGHDSAAIWARETANVTFCIFHGNRFATMGGSVVGFGCISSDPLLINPAADNFRLSSLSPAIDVGTDLGMTFNGPAPDMGAYETGILNDISIVPALDSLLADSTYQFDVIALDAYGFPASPGNLSWLHTFPSGMINASGLFEPDRIGQGQVIVTSNIEQISDTTQTMNVVHGALQRLTVIPGRDTISADSVQQFTAAGFDRNGNSVEDAGDINWSVTNSIGTIDTSGLFSARRTGIGFIRASSDLGPSGLSDTIVVVPGVMAYLDVVPSENIISIMTSYQYASWGYDSDSNFVGDITGGSVWSTTDSSGSITFDGFYTAGNIPGAYLVMAASGAIHDSGQVSVTFSGALNHIRIELSTGTPFTDTALTTDADSTRLYCRGYTSDSSLMGDVAVSWFVIGNDSIGQVFLGPGTSTTLNLSRPGTGQVVARYSADLADTSGIITCITGTPFRLMVSPSQASITADSAIQFTCVALDSDGNIAQDSFLPMWNVVGNIGTIDSAGLFLPTTAGIGYVIAFSGALGDTAGPITVSPGALSRIVISPDSVIISADTSRQFTVYGYDQKGNTRDFGAIIWNLTVPLGTIDTLGMLDAMTVGVTRVIAVSSMGQTDTTALVQVVAGRLTTLEVSPDSIELSTDSSITFTASGYDQHSNPTNTGWLTWEILGDIGDINPLGQFTPFIVGQGRVVASNSVSQVADTNRIIIVIPGVLDRIVITPDSANVGVGDTVLFGVQGFDSMYNLTDVGQLSWSVIGSIGNIDTQGVFIATSEGRGILLVTSSINDVNDISGPILVQALEATVIPLGNKIVYPHERLSTLLAFQVDNSFADEKSLRRIILHDASRGLGSPAERLANIDSVSLYLDADHDSLLTEIDSLITSLPMDSETVTLDFMPVAIPPQSDRIFLVSLLPELYARDGDTLDLYVLTSSGLQTGDGTRIFGCDSLNSLGFGLINGMVAEQLTMLQTGFRFIGPEDSLYVVMGVDIPRNGYQVDTLFAFNVVNAGTALANVLDSLILFSDNGDGTWNGQDAEVRLGRLAYTGNQWTISGLTTPLLSPLSRFYLAANLTAYPTPGATLAFEIPLDGVQAKSQNDGPLDSPVLPVDTMTIVTLEAVSAFSIPIPSRELVPGESSGPIFAMVLRNGYNSSAGIDSLRFALLARDPSGATQTQLNSQIDTLFLYADRDGDYSWIGPGDTLIAKTTLSNDSTFSFPILGLRLPSQGGEVGLAVVAQLDRDNAKNGNLINVSILDSTCIFMTEHYAVGASYPLQNQEDFVINGFPAACIGVNIVSSRIFYGGEANQVAFDFKLPGNGYANDSLNSLQIINNGSFIDAGIHLILRLWADLSEDGFSPDDVMIHQFSFISGAWSATGLSYPIGAAGSRFIVTVDVGDSQFDGGTIELEIPAGGVYYGSGTTGPDDAPVGNPQSHLVFPSNRITIISIPAQSSGAAPGNNANVLLTFAMYNGYLGQIRTLRAITLTNVSRTLSTSTYADYELGQVSLFFDSNNDRTFNNDLLGASGYFSNRRLTLSGLNFQLAPESLAYFFVISDLSLDARDSDSLAVSVASTFDLEFSDPVILNGDLPVLGGGFMIVDGSVRAQYDLIPLAP